MKWLIYIVVLMLLGALLRTSFRPSAARPTEVTTADVAAVYKALQATGKDGSFAVFIPPPLPGDDGAATVQFSIERGKAGLDWELLNPINIRDKDRFVELLSESGVRYQEVNRGNIDVLRTEDSRAPELCRQILERLYGVPAGVGVELIAESFEWPVYGG